MKQVALFLTSHSSTKGDVKAVTVCCHYSAGFGLSLTFVLALSSRRITALIWCHTLFLSLSVSGAAGILVHHRTGV